MRYFFSSGEASGESSAVLLAQAIRSFDPDAQFAVPAREWLAPAGEVGETLEKVAHMPVSPPASDALLNCSAM